MCDSPVIVDLDGAPTARALDPGENSLHLDDLTFSADGERLSLGQGHLYDTADFKLVLSASIIDDKHKDDQTGASFATTASLSPDGRTFVVGNGQSRLWFFDAHTGKLRKKTREFAPAPLTASTTLYWSPTGALAVAVRDGGEIRVMSAAGDVKKLLERGGNNATATWLPDSSGFVLSDAASGHWLYDASGTQRQQLARPDDNVERISWSNDARLRFVAGKVLKPNGTLVRALPDASSVSFSPDGKQALSIERGKVRITALDAQKPTIDLRTGEPSGTPSARWLDGGKRALYADDSVVEVFHVDPPSQAFPAVKHEGSANTLVVSPDGAWLAVSGGGVRLVRLRDGKAFRVVLDAGKGAPSVVVTGDDGSFAGSAELAARTLTRDGKPVPVDELASLSRPDLLRR